MKDLTLKEAQELLQIDKYALDEVCVEQSELFSKIALNHSEAINVRDMIKDTLSTEDAHIAFDIRFTAEKSNEKLTESKIFQAVLVNSKHKELSERYLRLKLEADQWSALRESFLQRASMIKLLCELYLSDYFSTKSVKSSKSGDEVAVKEIRRRQTLHRKEKEI